MALSSILLSTAILVAAPAPGDEVATARVALGRVCLPAILEARPIETLAKAAGMAPIPATAVGASAADKAWGLSNPDAIAIAWTDGSCTAVLPRGDKDAARAMAEKEILARPEGFKRGVTVLADGDRVERTAYCAQVQGRWAVVSLTLPGPTADARTRVLSSTTYLRPTRSPLCG